MKRLEPFALTIILPSGLYQFTIEPLYIHENQASYSLKTGDVVLGDIVNINGIWSGEKGCNFSSEEIQMIGESITVTHGC